MCSDMDAKKIILTDRDTKVLLDLYTHRFLTIPQLRRIHFVSDQTAFRRIRQLRQIGLIDCFQVPNIPESIHRLTCKGLQIVAESLGAEREALKWNDASTKPTNNYFMRHFLAINDFRISLRAECQKLGIRLCGFIPDYIGERTDRGGMIKYVKDVICDKRAERQEISHTPDGAFALEREAKVALFFLEIDLGTEVVSDENKGVLKMLRFYTQYLLDGKYQRYARDFGVETFKGFRSLIVTSSQARLSNIRAAAAKLNVERKSLRFQWIATQKVLSQSGFFGKVWQSVDPDDQEWYQIVK